MSVHLINKIMMSFINKYHFIHYLINNMLVPLMLSIQSLCLMQMTRVLIVLFLMFFSMWFAVL